MTKDQTGGERVAQQSSADTRVKSVVRLVLAAGVAYGSLNAAIDFGMGIEADHAAQYATGEQAQSLSADENGAFGDAAKWAGLAALSEAAFLYVGRRRSDDAGE